MPYLTRFWKAYPSVHCSVNEAPCLTVVKWPKRSRSCMLFSRHACFSCVLWTNTHTFIKIWTASYSLYHFQTIKLWSFWLNNAITKQPCRLHAIILDIEVIRHANLNTHISNNWYVITGQHWVIVRMLQHWFLKYHKDSSPSQSEVSCSWWCTCLNVLCTFLEAFVVHQFVV